jgi:periplasmic divalent cation tolerance protein
MLNIVVTTVEGLDDARRLARAAVEQSLAACVHIETVESVYFWEGAIQSGAEYRLSFKTTAQGSEKLKSWLGAHHPYALPAVYTLQVSEADPRYLAWVAEGSCAKPGVG